MKAIKYIAAIALLAGLVSCQQEFNPGIQIEEPQAEAVEVNFSVHFPEPLPVNTKSPMGEGPLVDGFNIVFCIYGSGGYVQNWIQAEYVSPITNTQGYITGGSFKVLLPLTDDKRIVHVMADSPVDTPIVNEYIDNVMEKLVDSDKEGSYWQEIVLEDGIQGVYENGELVGPTDDLVAAFTDIRLVRNFTRLTVTNEDESSADYDGFKVKRWALINVPTKGYVAPYTGAATFPEGYTDIKNFADGDDLLERLSTVDNYAGSIPPEATIDDSFPGDPDGEGAANYTTGGSYQYFYERPLPTSSQKQTAVLVEVEFDANHAVTTEYNELHPDDPVEKAVYWYKVEVLDHQGQYVPFYRNIAYTLKISGLEVAGEATAKAAFDGSYFGNISASLETASLNELSDGTSTIHVDLMDYTFLAGGTDVTLMKDAVTAAQFWFIPDVSFPTVDAPDAYFESTAGVCDIQVELVEATGYEPAVTAVTANPNTDADGSIKVTLENTGDAVKKSIIRVKGRPGDNVATNVNKYIYRDITITLMQTQDFANEGLGKETEISNNPTVTGVNNDVVIDLYLPADLGASIFPIQVRIEAENNTLSAVSEDLPVSTGKSVFDPNRNTFYFVRTITYSEYCYLNPRTKKYEYTYKFPMTFKTSKTGDNSTMISIMDLREYLYPDETPDFNSLNLPLGTVTP